MANTNWLGMPPKRKTKKAKRERISMRPPKELKTRGHRRHNI